MNLLAHPAAAALGWTLLHFLWQGALAGAGTALLLVLARRASARARHALACLGLLACIALPAGTLIHLWPEPAPTQSQLLEPPPAARLLKPAAAPRPTLLQRAERILRPALPWIVGAWAAGALALLLRLLGGWALLERFRSRRTVPAPPAWQARLDALARRMGLRRLPRLGLCEAVEGPVAHGWWKPAVLLPAALLTGLDPDLLEALLAHELAHILRQDYLANLLQTLCETLLFYHPAVWWISARIRATREEACDDLAAMAIGEPRRLALALAELDLYQLPAPALGAHQGDLMHRIKRLLHPTPPRPFAATLLPVLVATACLSPLLASSAPVQATATTGNGILRPADLVAQIDALAAREGIDPKLLRAVAEAESQYDPAAVSRLGSTGILQVMPETARRYGATDLSDSAQVAAAGARYLHVLLDRYQGDWSKAVAAYNVGEEAFDAGRLNPETPAYVARVLALAKADAVQPAGSARGDLERLDSGAWVVRMQVFALDGFDAEFRVEGSEKPVALVRVGGGPKPESQRSLSRPTLQTEPIPGARSLVIRVKEQGTGRWGEAAVDLGKGTAHFTLLMEKAPGH